MNENYWKLISQIRIRPTLQVDSDSESKPDEKLRWCTTFAPSISSTGNLMWSRVFLVACTRSTVMLNAVRIKFSL